MLSQKEAVYQATRNILGNSFHDGMNARDAISNNIQLRSKIRDAVFEALIRGEVTFAGDEQQAQDERYLRTYATGLVSNWFRKDRRLNGGVQYRPSFSRDGSGYNANFFSSSANKVEALRAAIKATDDEELIGRLEAEIEVLLETADLANTRGRVLNAGDAGSPRSSSRVVDQDEPPSMGSGHRGAVTDPEHDMRLKRNETEELHESRVEAGHRGGTAVRNQRGNQYFSEIGQKGGSSRH